MTELDALLAVTGELHVTPYHPARHGSFPRSPYVDQPMLYLQPVPFVARYKSTSAARSAGSRQPVPDEAARRRNTEATIPAQTKPLRHCSAARRVSCSTSPAQALLAIGDGDGDADVGVGAGEGTGLGADDVDGIGLVDAFAVHGDEHHDRRG